MVRRKAVNLSGSSLRLTHLDPLSIIRNARNRIEGGDAGGCGATGMGILIPGAVRATD